MPDAHPTISLNDKLNLETARIGWHELQKPFAHGVCIYVAADLDLVNIAHLLAADETAAIALLMREGKVGKVSDAQAQLFYSNNQPMWAVVVAPYVLVQADNTQIIENNKNKLFSQ